MKIVGHAAGYTLLVVVTLCVAVVGRSRGTEAPWMESLLQDLANGKNAGSRSVAAQALGKLEDPRAVAPLVAALGEPAPELGRAESVKSKPAALAAPPAEGKKQPAPVFPQSDKNAPLWLSLKSEKRVYEEGVPIIFIVTIRNISKKSISVMARYLSTPRELWSINSRQERISCDIPLDYQARAFERQDYIVLRPGQSQAFKLAICFSPFPTLKPDTYRMIQCYSGHEDYYEGSVRKKVEYPWKGTVVSDPLVIEVVPKGNRSFRAPGQH